MTTKTAKRYRIMSCLKAQCTLCDGAGLVGVWEDGKKAFRDSTCPACNATGWLRKRPIIVGSELMALRRVQLKCEDLNRKAKVTHHWFVPARTETE